MTEKEIINEKERLIQEQYDELNEKSNEEEKEV